MEQQQQEALQQLLSLTEEMLQLSIEQDWDPIQEKENLRREIIPQIFIPEIAEKDGQEVGNKIVYVLKLNEQITANLVAGKQSLSMEVSQLNRAKKATHAYLKFAK